MPAAMARATTSRWADASVPVISPGTGPAPRPTIETSRPVRPSVRQSMSFIPQLGRPGRRQPDQPHAGDVDEPAPQTDPRVIAPQPVAEEGDRQDHKGGDDPAGVERDARPG